MKELAKYKVVRQRDFVDTSGFVRKVSAPTVGTVSSDTAKPARSVSSVDVAAATTTTQNVDFWAGFDAFLKKHVPSSAQRELVARSFDEVRQSSEDSAPGEASVIPAFHCRS